MTDLGSIAGWKLGFHEAWVAKLVTNDLCLLKAVFLKQLAGFATESAIDFQIDTPSWLQCHGGIFGNGTIEEQRVGIGHKQGCGWLVLQHIALHVGTLAVANVGRIAHHHIKAISLWHSG